jgi:AcrR family transcriptional regulator
MSGTETPVDGDVAAVAGESLPSTRVPLDRDRIVAAAIGYIEAHGLPSLSMRKLGAELGVEAMALYRYVPGREDLLDAIVESIIDEMYADEDVLQSPQHGWQDYLQRLAHGVRRVALAHPRAFPLVASRPPEAPWLRPPLRSLRWVESFLQALTSEGFSDAAAVAAYRGFTGFLLGHLLLEVSGLGADVGPLDVYDEGTGDSPRLDLANYPSVERMSEALSEDQSAAEFEESLEDLLERLTLLRTQV